MEALCSTVLEQIFAGESLTAAQKMHIIGKLHPLEHALRCGGKEVALLALRDIEPDQILTVGRLTRIRKMIDS